MKLKVRLISFIVIVIFTIVIVLLNNKSIFQSYKNSDEESVDSTLVETDGETQQIFIPPSDNDDPVKINNSLLKRLTQNNESENFGILIEKPFFPSNSFHRCKAIFFTERSIYTEGLSVNFLIELSSSNFYDLTTFNFTDHREIVSYFEYNKIEYNDFFVVISKIENSFFVDCFEMTCGNRNCDVERINFTATINRKYKNKIRSYEDFCKFFPMIHKEM